MRLKETLVTVVLAASTALFSSGCTVDAGEDTIDSYDTPQVRFAEWFVKYNVVYYGSPKWCNPCRMFERDITPEGFEVLDENGNFVECSEYPGGPVSQGCIDAQVPGIPAYKAPWKNELILGYGNLTLLANELNYPGINELFDL